MRCSRWRGGQVQSYQTHLVANSLEVFVDPHSVANEAAKERVEDQERGVEEDEEGGVKAEEERGVEAEEDEEGQPDPPADLLVAHHVPDPVTGQHQELVVNRVSLLKQNKVKTNPKVAC